MFGGGSIQLARVFGIRIGVDPSWFLVLFLVIWSLSDGYGELFPGEEGKAFALATVSAFVFFGSVVLHELGHAVVAMRNGIGIQGIDLWLFGGLARMMRDTDTPAAEFKIAVAGPVVTALIAAVCFALGVALAGYEAFSEALFLKPSADVDPLEAVLAWLTEINVVLLVFNLIPGFPLDGGRIARAIAWWRTGDRTRATRFAARLGRGFAYLLIGLGIFWFLNGVVVGGIWFGVMGLFLAQAAKAADVQSRISARIEGLRVSDVMDTEPVAIGAQTKLDTALDDFFLRYGWGWFPVTDPSGRFLGFISRERVEAVPEQLRPTSAVDEVMAFDRTSDYSVGVEEPLETLLGSAALRSLGALMAVDREGILRGVVTLDQVRRALRPA